MTLLKYNQEISRNKKGKKVYDGKEVPKLPEDWQNKKSELTVDDVIKGDINYLIRPDGDIVVIDVDTKRHTKELMKLVGKKDYIVKSDNGTAHFYYKVPKKFFTKNRTRLANAIDILIGKSLVFTPNKYNTTKSIKQGSLDKITKMPKKVLRYLESKVDKSAIEPAIKDSTNILHYMLKDELEEKMELFETTKDFKYLYNIFSILTPAKYRQYTEPELHPNKIPDGLGIAYLQAISAKLAGDISVSPELHKRFISLIARELWDDPLSKSRLKAFLSNLTTQRYPDGSPVFVYDKNATKNVILISENKSPLYPLYRTLEDTYIVIREEKVVVIPSFTALKRFIMSQNVKAVFNGKQLRDFKNDNLNSVRTIQVIEDKTMPVGLGLKEFSYVYNIINHPPELEMLLFSKPKIDKKRVSVASAYNSYKGKKEKMLEIKWDDMPTIRDLLYNITYDHAEEQQLIISKLLLFLSKKLTTLDYSPIVIQLIGSYGTGKSIFTELLNYMTDSVKEVVFESNFNAEYKNSLFLYEDEGTMSPKIINRIKQLSGNSVMRVEAKGVNATYERNLSTIIVNSNKYKTMAQNMFDRRFVSLCSFNAPRLEIANIDERLREEAMSFAELLLEISNMKNNDIKHLSSKLYFDAVYWNDSTISNLFKDKVASRMDEEPEATLAYVITSFNDMDNDTAMTLLERALGYGFSFIITKGGEARVPYVSRGSLTYKGRELTNHALSTSNLIKYGVATVRSSLERGNICQFVKLPNELVCKLQDRLLLRTRCLRGMSNIECVKDLLGDKK